MPILRQRLIDEGIASEDELKAMEDDISQQIDAAMKIAAEGEFPEVAELKRDVFAEEIA